MDRLMTNWVVVLIPRGTMAYSRTALRARHSAFSSVADSPLSLNGSNFRDCKLPIRRIMSSVSLCATVLLALSCVAFGQSFPGLNGLGASTLTCVDRDGD